MTGSNGFIGAAVVARLLARGRRDVRALVRAGSDRWRLDALRERHPHTPFDVFEGSLARSSDAARALEGVDRVYHLAASLRGSPADMCLNTVVTSKHLLDAVIRRADPPRVVLISSFGVYGVSALPKNGMVDESTPIETEPARRDVYSATKLRQEQLFWEAHRAGQRGEHAPFELVVLRPGAVYGPGTGAFSGRVGIQLPGIFLFLGGDNRLPLTYVDNCAEATVLAGESEGQDGRVFNVVDDDLPTCRDYLDRFRREVRPVRALPVPYPLLWVGSHAVAWYHRYSGGQLPAIFTPYKTESIWKGQRFSNARLKALGWRPLVTTEEGLQRTFAHHRERDAA
ncbi:MAG: NAD-dependent epimerase/dehydratase family protein [Myxococcota bacterium]